MNIIELKDIWWRYPSFNPESDNPWCLKGINLEIKQGEFLGITGPSGAGKSTLCEVITGIIPHDMKFPGNPKSDYFRGSVVVFGEVLTKVNPSGTNSEADITGIAAPKVGLVMQDPEAQFLRSDLLHELSLGLQILGLNKNEIEERIQQTFTEVGLNTFQPIADLTHPAELSGGQKQRVAIGAFLAMRPKVLILDEPTSDLDPLGKLEVIKTIRNLREQYDMTIILVEHNSEVIIECADRIALLVNGQIQAIDTPRRFYCDRKILSMHGVTVPEIARIAHLANVNCENFPLTINDGLQVLTPRVYDRYKNISNSQEMHKSVAVPYKTPEKPPLIEAKSVNYIYPDGTKALMDVGLTIYPQDFIGLIGKNGSGKTTLAKILCGLFESQSGEFTFNGKRLDPKQARKTLNGHVGYVFQNPDHQIFTRRVYDEVAYGLQNQDISKKKIDSIVLNTLDIVGLKDKVDEDPSFIGKGERQRLAVAAILAMSPDIIIIDEPTTGQDYEMSRNIMQLLQKLNDNGTTVVVITHDMSLVMEQCQRLVVVHEGQIAYDGTPIDLFRSPDVSKYCLVVPQPLGLTLESKKKDDNFPWLANVKDWVTALS